MLAKQTECKHTYIKNNGFFVCSNCGETKSEIYYHDYKEHPTDVRFGRKKQYIQKLNEIAKYQEKAVRNHKKWNRLKHIQKWKKTREHLIPHHIKQRLIEVVNSLIYLTEKQKKIIIGTIFKRKPRSIKELYTSIYSIIAELEFPITADEYMEVVRSFSKRVRVKDVLGSHQRKYYWYIYKTLNQIEGLSGNDKIHNYKAVLNYYKLIRYKMYKAYSPIELIKFLCWKSVNTFNPEIPKKHRSSHALEYFCISQNHLNVLREVKKKGLDKRFFSSDLLINL